MAGDQMMIDPVLALAKRSRKTTKCCEDSRNLPHLICRSWLVSRKSMIGAITGRPAPERVVPSAVLAVMAAARERPSFAYTTWPKQQMHWLFGRRLRGSCESKIFWYRWHPRPCWRRTGNTHFMLKLGWATGKVFASEDGNRPTVLIGKDTRVSGYMLESALQAGLVAAGANVKLLGPLPTPGIALLTRTQKADAGIVISASHNLYFDNGIKFFNGQGSKLSDELELRIEAMIDSPMETVDSEQLGKASRIVDAAGRYVEYCKSTFPDELSLKGMKHVIECAHGAT